MTNCTRIEDKQTRSYTVRSFWIVKPILNCKYNMHGSRRDDILASKTANVKM